MLQDSDRLRKYIYIYVYVYICLQGLGFGIKMKGPNKRFCVCLRVYIYRYVNLSTGVRFKMKGSNMDPNLQNPTTIRNIRKMKDPSPSKTSLKPPLKAPLSPPLSPPQAPPQAPRLASLEPSSDGPSSHDRRAHPTSPRTHHTLGFRAWGHYGFTCENQPKHSDLPLFRVEGLGCAPCVPWSKNALATSCGWWKIDIAPVFVAIMLILRYRACN